MTEYNDNQPTISIPHKSTQTEMDLHMDAIAQKGVPTILAELGDIVQSAQADIYFAQRRLQFAKSIIDALHHRMKNTHKKGRD